MSTAATSTWTEAAAGRTVDLSGHLIVPGFVDMHVHGGGGGSFSSADPEECLTVAETHRRHGTTSMVASTVTGELDDLARQAAVLAELVQQGELAGIHFEGPFISAHRCGAHQPELLRDPDPADVRKLVDAAHGTASMMTVAPELPGGLESVRLLADAGVIAAIGHTDSTYDATRAGHRRGRHRRHPPLQRDARRWATARPARSPRSWRTSGSPSSSSTTAPICTPRCSSWRSASAGAGRVAFITDAMGAAGMNDGMYPLGPMRVEVKDGVARISEGPTAGSIAGSTLTLDRAFQRAVTVDGLTVDQAVQALSANPARLLGIDDRTGSLETGKDADLVVLDAAYDLVGVMRRGEWLVRPPGV